MGKNVKKVISLVLVFAMILTGMTFTGFDAKAADAANDTSATAEYEIYPTPRSVVYQDSSFTLANKTNVVYDSTIDEATQKRLNEVLTIQNITGTVTDAVASNGMNVLVGTVPGLRAAVRLIPASGINGMIFWQYLPVQRCRSM